MVTIWMNGSPQDHLMLPHRGLAYGDGLFETIRIHNRQAPLFARHLARLISSAHTLGFADDNLAATLPQQVRDRIQALPEAHGILKVSLLRQHQERGYGFLPGASPDVVIEFYPAEKTPYGWDLPPVRLGCCVTPVSVNAALAGHKHLNRLDSVLAAAECQNQGWDDGLRFAAGTVVEATSANVFVVSNNRLLTPELSTSGVKGVARQLVLDRAATCFDRVDEATLTLADIRTADAVFLTNAVMLIRRVAQVVTTDQTVNYPLPCQGLDRLELLLKEEFVL